MFSIGGSKTPSEDGFPTLFYQQNWHVVGHSVCSFIQEIFKESELQNVNRTLLCLIPKKDKPKFINQFFLSSLCNVIYKCATKIMVNCLKCLLPSLISPFQTSFMSRRYIQDNTLIAQELTH